MAAKNGPPIRVLSTLDPSAPHVFTAPTKKIHDSQDVSAFLTSKAYTDIMTWLLQLNRSMFPLKLGDGTSQSWAINSDAIQFSAPIRQLQRLLLSLEDIIQEVPPDTGPRRFGNISFRRWCEVVESRTPDLLKECLPAELLQKVSPDGHGVTAGEELKAYLVGSWGSGQRLDYGTGHELSFLAFLGGLWKLNAFPKAEPGVEERAIVIGVIQPCVRQWFYHIQHASLFNNFCLDIWTWSGNSLKHTPLSPRVPTESGGWMITPLSLTYLGLPSIRPQSRTLI
jgi:serine/threonine-protein phosphatase 2A activator